MTKSPHLASTPYSFAGWNNDKIDPSSGVKYSAERCGDKLSVIIINYNTPEMTERVIRRFHECEPALEAEIILIDNNSNSKLAEETIASLDVTYIENQENVGFARAVNQGINIATGEYILLLNSDVLIEPGAITELLDFLEEDPAAGVVGPKMVYPDGRAQVSSGYFPNWLREFIRLSTLYKIIPYSTFAKETRLNGNLFVRGGEVDWLSGGCLLIKRTLINQIGVFDGHYFFGIEDIDFCFRTKQTGFKVFYHPQVQVIHHHGLSSGGPRTIKKMEMERDNLDYFMKKNYPERVASRAVINIMHSMKIWLLRIILNFKF